MARADLLKKLFRGYKMGDHQAFMEAAKQIIEDEKKKSHIILANELFRILENSRSPLGLDINRGLDPIPKDSDRGSPLLEIRYPQKFLSDLVFTKSQLQAIEQIIDEFRQWEILETHGLTPSHKLLFCGPPGCGKTATAEALAAELGLPLLYVRFDSVVSSLLGETAANLRKVFTYAQRDSWVILFDEFDAIGRSRDDITEHGELKRVVNSFLQLLDGFNGRSLVIAATNFEQSLDPALWRRFDEIMRFDKPNELEINVLLNAKLGSVVRSESLLKEFSQRLYGMSHAEIERVCFDILKHHVLSNKNLVSIDCIEKAVNKQEMRRQILIRNQSSNIPIVDKEV